MPREIVINRCYGGFDLSDAAYREIAERKGWEVGYSKDTIYPHWTSDKVYLDCTNLDRDDPILVEVVRMLGEDANGPYSFLKIVEIPDDVGENWYIEEYDGLEWVAEIHRTWE